MNKNVKIMQVCPNIWLVVHVLKSKMSQKKKKLSSLAHTKMYIILFMNDQLYKLNSTF